MLRLILLLVLILVIGLMALAAVAVNTWGLGGFVGVVIGLIVAGMITKRLAGMALKAALMTPFKMKGAPLRNAQVVVHSVEPASPPPGQAELPAGDDERDSDDGYTDEDPGERAEGEALDWYRIDVTIRPTVQGTAFQLWEPGDLGLASPGSRATDDEDGRIEVDEVEIWTDGAWIEDEGYKYPGEQRLRLLFGVPQGTERLCFRYYFESFGEIRFPKRVGSAV
jgi:hypothetical protein